MNAADVGAPAHSGKQPNILVILTDQQSANALGCAGNRDLSTPGIDALARSGTRFTRAYCTSPLCVPSRASMLTGRYPSQLGVNDNIPRVPEAVGRDSFAHLLGAAGYQCVYAGKWHVPGIEHDGEGAPGREATSGFTRLHNDAHAGLAEACGEFLTAPQRQNRPFLLVASFVEPHGICEWARGQAPPSGEVDDPDWRELPVLPANFRPSSEEPEALRLVQQSAWTVHPTHSWDEEHWRRYRHAYYRLCERVDAQIERLLTALDESGLREDTLVVFTSDHGDMQGAHGWNQKKVLYDEAASVPFIVRAPGRRGTGPRDAGSRDAGPTRPELVSPGLDLLPTLCDYAGVELDGSTSGRSVRALVESAGTDSSSMASSQPAGWRDQIVIETEWTFPGILPPPQPDRLIARLLRSDQYAYLCHSWGAHREQLFDMEADPGQMTNLATSGGHQDVLADHRQKLAQHCEDLDDGFAQFVPGPGVPPR